MTLEALRNLVDDSWGKVPKDTEVEIRVSRPCFEDTKAPANYLGVEVKNGRTLVVIGGNKT